jgi:hypothetical protein
MGLPVFTLELKLTNKAHHAGKSQTLHDFPKRSFRPCHDLQLEIISFFASCPSARRRGASLSA